MSGSIGATAWQLAFECSPVVFTQGIATNMPGGVLPIMLLTEAVNFPLGVLSTGTLPSLDQAFAHWRPLPGTKLVSWQWGLYPFANQATAANAGINQQKTVSLMMQCPAKGLFGYIAKLGTMALLRQTLDQHAAQGGTYTVITPTAFYVNCLLADVTDVSSGDTAQPQVSWQWDFIVPLITLDQAQQVQSSLISKITNGLQTDGSASWSGLSPTVSDPNSVAAPGVIPSAAGSQAAGTAPLSPVYSQPLPALGQ